MCEGQKEDGLSAGRKGRGREGGKNMKRKRSVGWILLLVIWKLFFARRRYRYGRNVSRNRGNYRGPRRR